MEPGAIPVAISVIGGAVSVIFAIVAWLAKREVHRRDKEVGSLRKDVDTLLKVIPVMERFERDLEKESEIRLRASEQAFSRINQAFSGISLLDTEVVKHQNRCRKDFLAREDYDRLEALKRAAREELVRANERVDARLTKVQDTLVFILRKNGELTK